MRRGRLTRALASRKVDYSDVSLWDVAGATTTPTVNRAGLPGDLMVAGFISRGNTNFTPPDRWTSIVEVDAAGEATTHVFWRFHQAGDPATWTASSSASVTSACGTIALSGVSRGSPIGAVATAIGANPVGAVVTYPQILVPHSGSLIVGVTSHVGSSAQAPDQGGTERWDAGNASGSEDSGNGWTHQVDAGFSTIYTQTVPGGNAANRWSAVLISVSPA